MEVGNYTIPNVKHELAKIINFPLYLNIDLTNAFHQIPLHEETSARLSIHMGLIPTQVYARGNSSGNWGITRDSR
jgi:hypothetical protein